MKKVYIEITDGTLCPSSTEEELYHWCVDNFHATIMTPIFFELMDVAIMRKIKAINEKNKNGLQLVRKVDMNEFEITVSRSNCRISVDSLFTISGYRVKKEYTDEDVL
jgi:hypothetical protein